MKILLQIWQIAEIKSPYLSCVFSVSFQCISAINKTRMHFANKWLPLEFQIYIHLSFLWLVPHKRPSHYAIALSEWVSEWVSECNSGFNRISRLWYDTLVGLFWSLIITFNRCVIVLSTYPSLMAVEIYFSYPSYYILS